MRKTRLKNHNKPASKLPGYLLFSIFLMAMLGLCLQGYNHQADPEWGSDTPVRAMTQGAIHVAMQQPMEIPLSKGVPVGTLKLNGKTYVIYTTNENDRPQ